MRVRVALLAGLVAGAVMLLGAVSGADETTTFDKAAAVKALATVDLSSCKVTQPGDGHVLVTFSPKGKASEAVVDKGDFGAAAVAKRIAATGIVETERRQPPGGETIRQNAPTLVSA